MSKLSGLMSKLNGELLEISIGDDYEDILSSDSTKKVNSVIFGFLRDIVDDFIILDSFYIDKKGEFKSGNIIYINTWHIKAFTKVKSNGCLNDALMSVSDTRKIKHLLGLDD